MGRHVYSFKEYCVLLGVLCILYFLQTVAGMYFIFINKKIALGAVSIRKKLNPN